MNSCSIVLSSSMRLTYPNVDFRDDLLIPTPILQYPRSEQTFCLDLLPDNNTQICLSWFDVPGATHYLLQWSLNPQFNGPSIREVIVAAPERSYCLFYPEDIRQEMTIYWRVIAANLTTGGVSNKSETRKLTYNCNEEQNRNQPTKSDRYNVSAIIHGHETMDCCDFKTFWLELTYDCKYGYADCDISQNILDVKTIEWVVNGVDDPGQVEDILLSNGTINQYRIGVKTCTETTQVMQLCANITFIDNIDNSEFTHNTCFDVYLDCGTEEAPVCSAVNIPLEYQGTAESPPIEYGQALEVNCNCGGNCSFEDNSDSSPSSSTTPFVDVTNLFPLYENDCEFSFVSKIVFLGGLAETNYIIREIGTGASVYVSNGAGETGEELEFPIIIEYDGEPTTWYFKYETKCLQPSIFGTVGFNINNNNEYDYSVTYKVDCAEPDCNKDVFHLKGPVYQVTPPSVSEWPDCISAELACECVNTGIKINDCLVKVGDTIKVNPECCTTCDRGVLQITLASTTLQDPLCETVTHRILATLICEGKEDVEEEKVFTLPCDDLDTEYSLDICNCENILIKSAYNPLFFGIEADKPCNSVVVVDGEFNIKYGATSKDFEIDYTDKKWIFPKVNPDTPQAVLEDKTFGIDRVYFDGCQIKTDISYGNTACAIDCFDTECPNTGGFTPRSFDYFSVSITNLTKGGFEFYEPSVSLDCENRRYATEAITYTSPTGCSLTGRLFFEEGGGVRFVGSSNGNTPVEYVLNPMVLPCSDIIEQDTTVQMLCSEDGIGTLEDITFDITIDYNVYQCAASSITFDIDLATCDPFTAASTPVILDDKELSITIIGEKVPDDCSCADTDCAPLEARVNVAIGPNLETLGGKLDVNVENLVSKGNADQSLEVSYRNSKPSVTLPICDCVIFVVEPSEDIGPNNPNLDKVYLFKSVVYHGKALEPASEGDEILVHLVDYDNVNSGRIGTTYAVNNSGFDLSTGDAILITITDKCEKHITAVDFRTTPSDDTPEGEEAEQQCEGLCKWIWAAAEKLWYLDTGAETPCSAVTTTTSTTTTTTGDTTTTADCIGHDTTTTDDTTTSTSTTTTPQPGDCTYECVTGGAQYIWQLETSSCASGYTCPRHPVEGSPCDTLGQKITVDCIDPSSCGCLPPEHCGIDDGDCTYTYCDTFAIQADPPDCDTTTSTSTTTESPTVPCCIDDVLSNVSKEECCALGGTIDPNCGDTTTTLSPDCTNCTWIYGKNPIGWVKISDGCTATDCACSEPSVQVNLETCASECTTYSTSCVETPPPGDCVPMGCLGGCEWWWSCVAKKWYNVSYNCYFEEPCPFIPSVLKCRCPVPSKPGSDTRNECRYTSCRDVNTDPPDDPPPTTTGPTTSTTPDPDPCKTTTTASPECVNECRWESNISLEWVLAEDNCTESPCEPCGKPVFDPREDCEIAWTPCGSQDPTTTSTTTSEPCTGQCTWQTVDVNGVWVWKLIGDGCTAPSPCDCPSIALEGTEAFGPGSFVEDCGEEPEDPKVCCRYGENNGKVYFDGCYFYPASFDCPNGAGCPESCVKLGSCCENGVCTEDVLAEDCGGTFFQYSATSALDCAFLSETYPECGTTTSTPTPTCSGSCQYQCVLGEWILFSIPCTFGCECGAPPTGFCTNGDLSLVFCEPA
jgi:hypothetical protein